MKTYLRHKSSNVLDVKELIALEYLDFEGKYKNYTEQHDFSELCYVERGEVTLSASDISMTLEDGEIAIIPPGVLHSYSSEKGNKSRAFVVCFECQNALIRALFGAVFSEDTTRSFCMERIIEECKDTFYMNDHEELALLQEQSFGGQQAIILQLEYLLINLLRLRSYDEKSELVFLSGDSFYRDLANIIGQYMKSNLSKNLTLADLCRRFNYSRSFISKIFKEQMGISAMEYFKCLRMEEAKRRLEFYKKTVADIAESLGFSEAKYFSTAFKNYTGLTPTEYRHSLENSEK